MQLTRYLFLLGFFYSLNLTAQQGIVFTNGSVIEDYGTKTFTKTVGVFENFNRLLVHVDIQHSWVNDLELTITNPAGDKVTVFSRLGNDSCFGCDGSDIQLVFSDDALITYEMLDQSCDTLPAYSGNAQAMEGLDDLLNTDPNGDWTVELTDYWPHETGHINMIWMELTNYAAPDCTPFLNLDHQAKNVPLNTTIEWIPAPLATGYKIRLESVYNSNIILDYVDIGNVNNYELTALECGVEYDILLTPYNQHGSAICTELSFETEYVKGETEKSIELCYGDSIKLEASGGDLYHWSPEMLFDDPLSNTPLFFGKKNMVIELLIYNENGCEDEVQINVQVNKIEIAVDSVDHYRLDSPGFIEISVDGNIEDHDINWTGPDGFMSTEDDIYNLEIGCYMLAVENLLTTCTLDTSICVDDLTELVNLSDHLDFNFFPNPVHDQLTIELLDSNEKNLKISFTSPEGHSREIGTLFKGQFLKTINVEELNPGFYILTLSSPDKQRVYSSTFIKE